MIMMMCFASFCFAQAGVVSDAADALPLPEVRPRSSARIDAPVAPLCCAAEIKKILEGLRITDALAASDGPKDLSFFSASNPGTVKCFFKREAPIAPKEEEICSSAMIGAACTNVEFPLYRTFRAVLSYVVSLAVGSRVLQPTYPVFNGKGKLVGHCLKMTESGLQPRRLDGRFGGPFLVVSGAPDSARRTFIPAKKTKEKPFPLDGKTVLLGEDDDYAVRNFPTFFGPLKDDFLQQLWDNSKGRKQTLLEHEVVDRKKSLRCGVVDSKQLIGEAPEFSWVQSVRFKRTHEVRLEAQESILELQALDHVSMQCDRHAENFFVDGADVMGIDLDMSWGASVSPFPLPGQACKLPISPPPLSAAVRAKLEILKYGRVIELTTQVGAKLNVPPILIKSVGKAGQARLLKLLEPSDATELSLDNSMFVRLNFEADQHKKCRQAFKNL